MKIKGGFTVNTLGFIRGYMAKQMGTEEFLEVVMEAMEKEFQWDVTCKRELEESEINYVLTIDKDYVVKLSINSLKELQGKSPYSLDKYIYQKLMEQGMEIKKDRSQYIKYCFLNKSNS